MPPCTLGGKMFQIEHWHKCRLIIPDLVLGIGPQQTWFEQSA
jgi:hypothetical protein